MKNAALVQQTGRLRYIEPTNLNLKDNFSETINFPYEDL